MKEVFIPAVIRIVAFENEDIITTSNTEGAGFGEGSGEPVF